MREKVNFRKINHPRYKYLVTYSQGRNEDGKPIRRKAYFKTKAEASEFASRKRTQLTNEGNKAEEITGAERRAVHSFRELVAGMAGLPEVPTLERAVEFYKRHLQSTRKRATCASLFPSC